MMTRFLNNLKVLIIRLWKWIKSLWKKNNKAEKRKQASYQEVYDNTDWIEIKYDKRNTNIEEVEEEREADGQYESISDLYNFTDKNNLIITMPVTCSIANTARYCKTDANNHIMLVQDEDFMCLFPTIKLGSMVVKVFVGHTYALLTNQQDVQSTLLNPQVIVIPKTKTILPMPKTAKNKFATIMTVDKVGRQHYIIETTPSTIVNVAYLKKGKPHIGTIALIVTIHREIDMIWSGSIITYDRAAFIVSNVTSYEETGVLKIIAFAIASHDVKITTQGAYEEK